VEERRDTAERYGTGKGELRMIDGAGGGRGSYDDMAARDT
jgi:hypothetical protein